MRKIFEAADGQPDADDVCFVSNGCTALQIAALYPPLTEQEEQKLDRKSTRLNSSHRV